MSFQTFDTKWGNPTFGTESGEITWSMNWSSALDPHSSFSIASLEAATFAAFDRWEAVADLDFRYVTSGADLTLRDGAIDGSGNTVGQASWSTNGVSTVSGRITMDVAESWSPYGQSGGQDWYAVMLHEIGHIIGLDHVNDTSEIMNPFVRASDLGDGDIRGAQFIYGAADGAPTPPPPSTPTVPDDDGGDAVPAPGPGGGSGDSSGGGGAILGILALLGLAFSVIFGFGAGGGAAFAAAAKAEPKTEDEEEDMSSSACGCDGPCDCALPAEGELLTFTHNVYVTEAEYLAAGGDHDHDHSHDGHDHAHAHGACGHDGPCDCHTKTDEASAENVVMLTDLIPVTCMVEESLVPDEDGIDEEEDLLAYV